MTTAALPRLTAAGYAPSALLSFFASIADGISEGRSIAQRYDFLSGLTNAELAGRGLTRQDISRAAVTGF